MKRTLFKLARSRVGGLFIGTAFAHLSRFMPLDVLAENGQVILFHHPVPSAALHWLCVPKQRVPNLMSLDMSVPSDAALAWSMVCAMRETVQREEVTAYRLVINGGAFQDVAQLHMHLLPDGVMGGDGMRVHDLSLDRWTQSVWCQMIAETQQIVRQERPFAFRLLVQIRTENARSTTAQLYTLQRV